MMSRIISQCDIITVQNRLQVQKVL